MKSIIKLLSLLIFLHCSRMQGMEGKSFSTVDIDSNCYCGDVIIEGGPGTYPQQEPELNSLEWQKRQNSSWYAIMCSCFVVKKK